MTTKWKRLEPAYLPKSMVDDEPAIRMQAEYDNSTLQEARAKIEAYEAASEYWRNDLYQVQVRSFYCEEWHCEMKHLNIRRVDGAAVFDWRHRQLIKNQLLGEECEAMEIYPAESRLNDTSNKYHLWGFTDPTIRFPFGMQYRDVISEEVKSPPGYRQRRI
jgi:hypothetical protein